MKGYKATNNMKCLDLTYVVGKTYTIDKLEICSHGFHFCEVMEHVTDHYLPTEDFVLLEVEALGEIQTEDNKSATDKLKVIRVVPREEYTFDVYQYEYDSFGNKIRETNTYGHVHVYEYDSFGNKIKATDAVGNFWQYEYDSFGNKIKQTTPSGDVYQCEYDSFGNNIKLTTPSGDVWQHEYDSFGNKIKEIRPSGFTLNITIE
jgi:YD repeat-containing protein